MRTRNWLLVPLLCALIGPAAAQLGLDDWPDPEVYARAEDQERARRILEPCSEADLGRGCHRYGDRLSRDIPCQYRINANTIGGLPTDQCFKMDEPRRYRGIWIDQFEGQEFIPEGQSEPEWPKGGPEDPGWREKFQRAREATIWLDVDRVKLKHGFRENGRRVRIEFIGRKTKYPGWYGHLGMSGQEIIVDKVISMEEME